MCPDFIGCCSGGHRCSHNASILTCVCTTRPSRTWSMGVGMFLRPLLKAATHHRYIVPKCSEIRRCLPASSRPAMRCRSNSSSSKRVSTHRPGMVVPYSEFANTVHLSKHHSYCLQSQNTGCKDRPPERHLIADDNDR